MSQSQSFRVIITGGCGFLGQCLAREILRREQLNHKRVSELVLADVSHSDFLFGELADSRVKVSLGSVASRAWVDSLFKGAEEISVFHLASIMSGGGEKDFDLCVNVNLQGSINVLEAARATNKCPRVIFTSTGAVIGSGAPTDHISPADVVSDASRCSPHTTYGATKACVELLLSDYSRKGFVKGRGLRLPTIVVRAGAPNAATTSCFSSVVREPLAGVSISLPIAGDIPHAVAGYRAVVSGLLILHETKEAIIQQKLGYDRTVFLPSLTVTLAEVYSKTKQVLQDDCEALLGKIDYDSVDDNLSQIVASFAVKCNAGRAVSLGIPRSPSLSSLLRHYVEDFPAAVKKGIVLRDEGELARTFGDARIVLVTGASRGIGRAVAIALAKEWGTGVSLVLAARSQDSLSDVEAACRDFGAVAVSIPTDVRSEKSIKSLFAAVEAEFGRLDFLFNNAGISLAPTPIEDVEASQWKQVLDVNLTAAFLCSQHAFRIMKQQSPQGGRIINNGSISAQTPRPMSAAYTASKHAILGLTKSTSLDGRAFDISCGQIDIGNCASDMTRQMSSGMPQADGTVRAEPVFDVSDVANAVVYMASLPNSTNVLNMTIMANKMPFVGRG